MEGNKNGSMWLDDLGNPIQAHGGMITRFGDLWYWYGEHKGADNCPGTSRVDVIGVSCYTSPDLLTWHYEGLALKADPDHPSSPLHPSQVLERPKVLHCPATGKYVMWFHADSPDYTRAAAGCAVSDTPTGPFTFLHALQPNRFDCRDMTLFQDTEGRAWLVHSGNWNKTLYFSRLTDDYLGFTGEVYPALIDQEREAPALMAWEDKYLCITSGCTGWAPNTALVAQSRFLTCGWKLTDAPCTGPGARQTFGGQSTYIFKIGQVPYLMLDHWNPKSLRDSGYSILRIHMVEGRMEIPWQDTFIPDTSSL